MTSLFVENDRLWRNQTFSSNSLRNLPRYIRVSDAGVSGRTLVVDYALESEVTSFLLDLLRDSSRRADNVGQDEVDGHYYNLMTDIAEIFVVRSYRHKRSFQRTNVLNKLDKFQVRYMHAAAAEKKLVSSF